MQLAQSPLEKPSRPKVDRSQTQLEQFPTLTLFTKNKSVTQKPFLSPRHLLFEHESPLITQTNPPNFSKSSYQSLVSKIAQQGPVASTNNGISRKNDEDQLNFDDSIKPLAQEVKKIDAKKRKYQPKGTMRIEDLWGQSYKKEVSKHSRPEKFTESDKEISNLSLWKQLSSFDKVQLKSQQSSPRLCDISPILPKAKFLETPKKQNEGKNVYQSSTEEDSIFDFYGMKSTTKRNVSHPHILIPISNQDYFQPVKSAHIKGPSLNLSGHARQPLSDRPNYPLKKISSHQEIDSISRKDKFRKKNIKTRNLSEDEKINSKEGLSKIRNKSLSRDLEFSKTKVFIEETNDYCNGLIGNCQIKQQELGECLKLIQDLEKLFVPDKSDKSRRDETIKKEKLIKNCQFIIQRRNKYL